MRRTPYHKVSQSGHHRWWVGLFSVSRIPFMLHRRTCRMRNPWLGELACAGVAT